MSIKFNFLILILLDYNIEYYQISNIAMIAIESLPELPQELYVEIAKYDVLILYRFRQCCHKLSGLADSSLKIVDHKGDSDAKLFREFSNVYYRGFYIKCEVYNIFVMHQSPVSMQRLWINRLSMSFRDDFKRSYDLVRHVYSGGDAVEGRSRYGTRRWDRVEYSNPIHEYVYRFFIGGYNTMYVHTHSTTNLAPRKLYIIN